MMENSLSGATKGASFSPNLVRATPNPFMNRLRAKHSSTVILLRNISWVTVPFPFLKQFAVIDFYESLLFWSPSRKTTLFVVAMVLLTLGV